MAASRSLVLFLAVSSLVCTARAPLAQTRRDLRIVANVELVQIPVIVFDDKGAVAANLKKDDFRVLEDGVEQQLVYCERERESVSFVILADQSESTRKRRSRLSTPACQKIRSATNIPSSASNPEPDVLCPSPAINTTLSADSRCF